MLSSKRRPRHARLLGAVALTVAAVVLAPAVAHATSYYVNNQVACSNGNPGTSTGAPWCNASGVNAHGAFSAGDQILLARGATFGPGFAPTGSGTSGSYITIDAYGSGDRPRIQGTDQLNETGITLTNQDFWAFKNLDISAVTVGIGVKYTTLGHEGLNFEDLALHDFANPLFGQSSTPPTNWPSIHYPTGIHVTGAPAPVPNASQWAGKTIRMTRIEAYNLGDAFDVSCGFVTFTHGDGCMRDIVVRNALVYHNVGAPLWQNLRDLTIVDSEFTDNGNKYQAVGTTGSFLWQTRNVYLANTRFSMTPSSFSGANQSPDQTGIDVEGFNADTYFRGGLVDLNAGSGIEILQLPSRQASGDYSTGNDIWNVTFNNNGGEPYPGSGNDASIHRIGNSSGVVKHNAYYEPNGLTSGNWTSGYTLSDNTAASSELNLYHAISGWAPANGANGWSYEYFHGSWVPLTFDDPNNRWGTSAGYVSQFDVLPNNIAADWTARTWTAPRAGTIAIRGRVLKNDTAGGDGVRARITQNGTVVWPASGTFQSISANDLSGFDTHVDSLSVAAGDKIRFEVNDGGATSNANDLTSWTPGIVYSAASGTVTRTDDRTTGTGTGQFNYSGSWSNCTSCTGPSPARYSNSATWSATTNNTVTFKFTGRQIALWGEVRNSHGIGAASICDANGANCGDETFFDEYRSTDRGQQLMFRSPTLAAGTYTLKVRVAGARNLASSANTVVIDAVDVTS